MIWEQHAICWEADPRHAELAVAQLQLDGARPVCTPGTKEEEHTMIQGEDNHDDDRNDDRNDDGEGDDAIATLTATMKMTTAMTIATATAMTTTTRRRRRRREQYLLYP